VAIDVQGLLAELNELRALAAKKYVEDPLPATDKEARLRMQAEIAQYGLEANVAELETRGYTILPPGKGAPPELIERLRTTILRVAEERQGQEAGQMGVAFGAGEQAFHLLPVDTVFEEAVMNPVTLALVTYLAGYRAKLSQCTALIKTNQSDAPLHIHTDASAKWPAPWPAQSQTANVNWFLTDYTRENGPLCVVPGSHLWCRPPGPEFLMAHDHEDVEMIEAPAGSILVWHSNLWHGALPRTAEGKRVTLVMLFMRPHLRTQEDYALTTTAEMIERNPARLGVITGGLNGLGSPWWDQGPRFDLDPSRTSDLGTWT